MFNLKNTKSLKSKIFELDNTHCFIERENFLSSLLENDSDPYFYSTAISNMLASVSTPVYEDDIIVGRVVEGPADGFDECPSRKIFAKGHMTPNYSKLIDLGYKGILKEIALSAKRLNTEKAYEYQKNAEILVSGIDKFAKRYAIEAKKAGNIRAYEALLKVPYEPAYDLYSALQSIWLMHMIASCYVGSRDYAFGYMDDYLYPYYLKEKENGTSEEDIRMMLAGFFIKANEICGRHTHNYMRKPILSQASKQYVLLDGGKANDLSRIILDAAQINCMAEPIFTVVLSKDSPEEFKSAVFGAMVKLTDKLQVFNCESMKEFLAYKKLPSNLIDRPALSACCTFDTYRTSVREEFYLPTVQIFDEVLFKNEFSSKEQLLAKFGKEIQNSAQQYINESRYPDYAWVKKAYVLDTLLLTGCNENCEYPIYSTPHRVKNIFLPGIATLGDSLHALDTLVFNGNIPYSEFINMLQADFVGFEEIREKILKLEKFGNDSPCDAYTVEIANRIVEAVESCEHTDNEFVIPSFYSLERDNSWAEQIPATPNGRKAGAPISENQSPTYGADTAGLTALLCSVAKLPFTKTGAGGLNLTFSSKLTPEILGALINGYFSNGGLHIGISMIDKAVLEDAMEHPERYPTLTVRLYGFSEYFISLPRWQQIAVLNRTAY